jgi:hydroxymethylbilane synthase
MPTLRLGTRASALARWQAEWVAAQFRGHNVDVEFVPITTTGDQYQGSLQNAGRQGVFTKEIQWALLEGRIDLAVHSLKDLPTVATPGLCLAAVPERGPVADVLVVRNKGKATIAGFVTPLADRTCDGPSLPPAPCLLFALPPRAVVGTGSLRRRSQLLHVRRDLELRDVRGNVETRIRKLQEGTFDALILAEAGLRRLGLDRHIAEVLPLELMLPAIGQGALGLEVRTEDEAMRRLVALLDHASTRAAVSAERAMLAALQGGCLAPIAGLGRVEGDRLTLVGRVTGADGAMSVEAANFRRWPDQPSVGIRIGAGGEDGGCVAAESLGRQVAESLLAQGAGDWIQASRSGA